MGENPTIKLKDHESLLETVTTETIVVTSRADQQDFYIRVRASSLKDVREELSPFVKNSKSYDEIVILVITLLLTYTMTAIIEGEMIGSINGVLAYIIFPLCSVAIYIIHGFFKRNRKRDIANAIERSLRKLPDPDQEKSQIATS